VIKVTLDGKTLNVDAYRESLEAVDAQWDEWDEGYKRRVRILGGIRTWTLECWETETTWANSQLKHFMDKLKAGEAISLVIKEDDETIVDTNVYILNITRRHVEAPSKRYRRFTIILQEA